MTHDITFTNTLIIIILLTTVTLLSAQEPSDDSEPTENNIVCFAAKKQWVCAPADEQDKAKEKAMKLVLDTDQQELADDSVEIQTLQPINIGEQAREVNTDNNMQFDIKDFTPREDAIENDETVDKKETVQNQVAASVPQAQNDAMIEPTKTAQEEQEYNKAPTSFRYWQNNFAEQWTFQVVGTSNRHHIDDFITRNGLRQQSHTVVKTQRDGADWWIVLTGLYASKEQAKSEQHTLPVSLADGAWVRQIKTIEGQAD